MSQSPLTPWSRCSRTSAPPSRRPRPPARVSRAPGRPRASPPLRPHLHHGRARQGPSRQEGQQRCPRAADAWTSPSTGRTSTTRTTPTVRSAPSSSPSRARPNQVLPPRGLQRPARDNRKRFRVRHPTAQGPPLLGQPQDGRDGQRRQRQAGRHPQGARVRGVPICDLNIEYRTPEGAQVTYKTEYVLACIG